MQIKQFFLMLVVLVGSASTSGCARGRNPFPKRTVNSVFVGAGKAVIGEPIIADVSPCVDERHRKLLSSLLDLMSEKAVSYGLSPKGDKKMTLLYTINSSFGQETLSMTKKRSHSGAHDYFSAFVYVKPENK